MHKLYNHKYQEYDVQKQEALHGNSSGNVGESSTPTILNDPQSNIILKDGHQNPVNKMEVNGAINGNKMEVIDENKVKNKVGNSSNEIITDEENPTVSETSKNAKFPNVNLLIQKYVTKRSPTDNSTNKIKTDNSVLDGEQQNNQEKEQQEKNDGQKLNGSVVRKQSENIITNDGNKENEKINNCTLSNNWLHKMNKFKSDIKACKNTNNSQNIVNSTPQNNGQNSSKSSQDVSDQNHDDESSTNHSCGAFGYYPSFLQRFATPPVFLMVFCLQNLVQSAAVALLMGSASSIEKHFHFSSRDFGALITFGEFGPMITAIVLSHMGGRGNRPRWMALGQLASTIGLLMGVMNYLIYPPSEISELSNPEGSQTLCRYRDLITELIVPLAPKRNGDSFSSSSLRSAAENPPEICFDSNAPVYFSWLMVFSLIGVGNALVYSVGAPYMDDSIPKKDSPMYFAASMAMRILGPLIGFSATGLVMKIYVNPLSNPGLSTSDPRWIGAWWLGCLLLGLLFGLVTLLTAIFPKKLRHKSSLPAADVENRGAEMNGQIASSNTRPKMNNIDMEVERNIDDGIIRNVDDGMIIRRNKITDDNDGIINKEAPSASRAGNSIQDTQDENPDEDVSVEKSVTYWEKIIVFRHTMVRLLRNKVVVYSLIADFFSVSGAFAVFIFLPKYLEHQFRVTKSTAVFFTGLSASASTVVGVLCGGLFVVKYRPTARTITKITFVSKLIYIPTLFALMSLNCGFDEDYPGVLSMDETNLDLYRGCSGGCECSKLEFIPVCVTDGPLQVTFFSPCHAGCYIPTSPSDRRHTSEALERYVSTSTNDRRYLSAAAHTDDESYFSTSTSERNYIPTSTFHNDERYLPTSNLNTDERYFPTSTFNNERYAQPLSLFPKNFIPLEVGGLGENLLQVEEEDSSVVYYRNCSCGSPTAIVSSGYCKKTCSGFIWFNVIQITVLSFVGLGTIGAVLIGLRCVSEEDKAPHLGMKATVMSMAMLMNPIIVGSLTDSACMVWEEACNDTGACWIYNVRDLGHKLFYTAIVMMSLSVVFEYFLYRNVKHVILFDDENNKGEDDITAVFSKIFKTSKNGKKKNKGKESTSAVAQEGDDIRNSEQNEIAASNAVGRNSNLFTRVFKSRGNCDKTENGDEASKNVDGSSKIITERNTIMANENGNSATVDLQDDNDQNSSENNEPSLMKTFRKFTKLPSVGNGEKSSTASEFLGKFWPRQKITENSAGTNVSEVSEDIGKTSEVLVIVKDEDLRKKNGSLRNDGTKVNQKEETFENEIELELENNGSKTDENQQIPHFTVGRTNFAIDLTSEIDVFGDNKYKSGFFNSAQHESKYTKETTEDTSDIKEEEEEGVNRKETDNDNSKGKNNTDSINVNPQRPTTTKVAYKNEASKKKNYDDIRSRLSRKD